MSPQAPTFTSGQDRYTVDFEATAGKTDRRHTPTAGQHGRSRTMRRNFPAFSTRYQTLIYLCRFIKDALCDAVRYNSNEMVRMKAVGSKPFEKDYFHTTRIAFDTPQELQPICLAA